MSSGTINIALNAMLIVMVKKKDGSNRVCVDFWKLNKITEEEDPEPMKKVLGLLGVSRTYVDDIVYNDSWE